MAKLAWVNMGGCSDDTFAANGPRLKSFEASVLAHDYDDKAWRLVPPASSASKSYGKDLKKKHDQGTCNRTSSYLMDGT
jgi:hypothetical protein